MMKKKGGFLSDVRKHKVYYIMILPMIIYFALFCYLPMSGIYMAFVRYDFKAGLFNSQFVGLDNFKFLFSSGKIWQLIGNTLFYNILFIGFGMITKIAVAIMLKEITVKKYVRVTQTMMFMPYFVSMVIVSTIVYNILSPEYGMLNVLLENIGLKTIDVYRMPQAWPVIMTIVDVWKGLGYGVVIYLAALLSMDEEIYEAAYIDGANRWKRIRYVTLPLLKPTAMVLLLMNIGHILKGQFDLFYQLVGNNGQLFKATDIIDTYVYRSISQSPNYEMGSAAGLFQSVVGLGLILSVNALLRRWDPENALF